MTDKKWVVLGRFGRSHGLKGFITVISFTEPRESILGYRQWYGFINKRWEPLTITTQDLNNKHILVKIAGCDSREAVAEYTNIEIAVPSTDLPELETDEYYWHELIGMQVINSSGDSFGQVEEIMPTGANDVLVIKGEKSYLIPYVLGKYVLQVDREKRKILVDWDKTF